MIEQTREDGSAIVAGFLDACSAGDLPRVQALAARMADIDVADKSGRTGLMAAAARNRTDIMCFLLEMGADANKANMNGTTPLMFAKTAAFAYGDCGGMKILLDAGANRDARDRNGLTALEYVIERAELVRNFLETY